MTRQPIRPQGRALREGLRERWRPIHPGEAFQHRTPLTRRLIAQALHYEQTRDAQRLAARLADGAFPAEGTPLKSAAQLNALYSDLPTRFAAQAAVGHTAYLEYRSRTQEAFAPTANAPERLERLVTLLQVHSPAEHKVYEVILSACSEAVATRLSLHALARETGLGAVEHYRVYLAAQAKLPPTSITDVIRMAVVLGDLLGPLLEATIRETHPLLVGPLAAATAVSRLMEAQLESTAEDELTIRARDWVEAMVVAIAPFALNAIPTPPRPRDPREVIAEARARRTRSAARDAAPEFPPPEPAPGNEDMLPQTPLAPLDEPPAPVLLPETPEGASRRIEELIEEAVEALRGQEEGAPAALRSLKKEIDEVLHGANEETPLKQDPRPDRVQEQACARPFQEGEIQGNPEGFTLVEDLLWGDKPMAKAMVRHEVLVPPEDTSAWHALRRETAPLARQLRRLLYPSLVTHLERVRYRASGAPDPRRLALFPFSDTIYQQHRQERVPAPSNIPRCVVLLACDGSGSMGEPEIRVLKLLTCAFMESLVGVRGVHLLAGAYNDNSDRGRFNREPMVRWLHHPKLTPGRTPLEAGRAIAAFPDKGTGRNHDTVSLSYMLDEAIGLARGGTCYLVNLTDTRFNSPDRSRSGQDVMEDFLREAKAQGEIDLDYTLVGIGADEDYRLDGADAVLTVPPLELADTATLVDRVARYVTESVAARRAGLE